MNNKDGEKKVSVQNVWLGLGCLFSSKAVPIRTTTTLFAAVCWLPTSLAMHGILLYIYLEILVE